MKLKLTFIGIIFSLLLNAQTEKSKSFQLEEESSSSGIKVSSTFQNKKITLDADTKPTLPKPNLFIDFVGSGDLQKSLSQGQEIQANTGIGVDLERFFGDKKLQSLEIESRINIASSADQVVAKITNGSLENRRDFGSYMLNPISSKQALFLNINSYFGTNETNKKFSQFSKVISGFNIRALASNSLWKYDTDSCNLGALLFRAGIFHEFIPWESRLTNDGRSKYSITFGLNYTYRGLFGDITTLARNNFREKVLGNQQKRFSGWEWSFGLRLNNLIAEFQAPVLDTKYTSIEGFNNTQFIFSIRFLGGFSLKLKDDNSGAKEEKN